MGKLLIMLFWDSIMPKKFPCEKYIYLNTMIGESHYDITLLKIMCKNHFLLDYWNLVFETLNIGILHCQTTKKRKKITFDTETRIANSNILN